MTQVDILTEEDGHVAINWDPDDEESIRLAEEMFRERRKEGWAFFLKEPDEDGYRTGKEIKKFDRNNRELIMEKRVLAVPAKAGG